MHEQQVAPTARPDAGGNLDLLVMRVKGCGAAATTQAAKARQAGPSRGNGSGL